MWRKERIGMLEPQKHPNLHGMTHGFFSRQGGHSTGLYESLNCGLGSNDNPENVEKNLGSVQQHLRAHSLVTLRQIHSAQVVTVEENDDFSARPEADALVTRRSGVALGVLSADCAPILFADTVAGVVGAAHAGWKGALYGIAEATVAAMCALGAQKHAITAIVGPAIAQTSYQVDACFRQQFLRQDQNFAQFFDHGGQNDRYQFDLEGFLVAKLQGMSLGFVSGLGIDTYPVQNGYFSFRRCSHRHEVDYGRHISAIALGEK